MQRQVYRRTPRVLQAAVADELVAFNPDDGESFGLNPVAATIWNSLDQPKSFTELRDELLAKYELSEEQCAADLQDLLDGLLTEGLIEKVSRPRATIGTADRRAFASDKPSASDSGGRPAKGETPDGLTRELSLLVECCRWSFARDNGEHVRELAIDADWARFVALARFHRVQALVWESLRGLDVTVTQEGADALAADAAQIASANLKMAVECGELLERFSECGIPLLFIKGLTLGALAYANPILKMGWDIDVLVAPSHLEAAADVLRGRGYELEFPNSSEPLQSWHRHEKESVWANAAKGTYVELHTRLADSRWLIPTIGAQSPRQDVEVAPGILLPTLALDELFAYLCVHGASSAWFRSKWITDLAAFVHGRSPREMERVYRRSQELGAGRAAGQALLLADRLFGTLQDLPSLRDELESGRATRWLCRAALHQITRGPVEPTSKLFGTATIHSTQLLLLPSAAFKISELVRQARTAIG